MMRSVSEIVYSLVALWIAGLGLATILGMPHRYIGATKMWMLMLVRVVERLVISLCWTMIRSVWRWLLKRIAEW